MWLCLIALSCAAVLTLQGCGGNDHNTTKPSLPSTMIAGYTSGASAEKVSIAVKQGVNVIFWSFMELSNNTLSGGVKAAAVANVTKALKAMNRTDVIHFVSFGGWNVAHTLAGTCGNVACTGAAYAKAFRSWNEQMKSDVPDFEGFAGIDWDLEGVNDASSSSNSFDFTTLEIMRSMSDALRKDFLISMVPPQSYFNCKDSGFDLSLRHSAEQDSSFLYAGLNAYTALYAKCPECFDVVMVQLYESYSPAGFDLYWDGNSTNVGKAGWPRVATPQQETSVIRENMKCLVDGWSVKFNGFWSLPDQIVSVPASKVVIGLANKWALPTPPSFKVPFFSGQPSGLAWCQGVKEELVDGTMAQADERVRGFMYWDISDDTADASLVTDLMKGMATCGNKPKPSPAPTPIPPTPAPTPGPSPTPTPTPPPTPDTCKASILDNMNCDNGHNLGSKAKQTQAGCCALCALRKDCTAWTWNKDVKADPDQTCYLHPDCTSPTADSGRVSGRMEAAKTTAAPKATTAEAPKVTTAAPKTTTEAPAVAVIV